MSAKVEFYFDLSSPYTYIASKRIDDIVDKYDAQSVWKPFLLGGAYIESGNRAPLEVPNKFAYMKKDLSDYATLYDIDFRFPDVFPISSVKPMRAAIAAEEAGKLVAFAREMFEMYFVKNTDISDPAAIEEAAVDAGIDPDWLLRRIVERDIKDALREVTAEAVGRGAFGAPTFFVDGKMFWGCDRLPFVEECLKGNI